ncbi:MAG: gamma-glutamylcyclotransferase family protein [Thermaceae bacterium]
MERVFAYGTLKQGGRNHPWVASSLLRVVPGFVEGHSLFLLEEAPDRPYAYPAMVRGRGRVYGEVLFLLEGFLPLLDVLEEEGVEYRREKVPVHTEEGMLEAWAYLYLGDLGRARPLPEGVWPIVEP